MIIYQYDGSIEGYLTAVYDARMTNEECVLFSTDNGTYQLSFDTEFIQVINDLDKADALIKSLRGIIGRRGVSDIYHVFESSDSQKDVIIYNFINLALARGKIVLSMLSNPYVVLFNDLNHKVRNEIHRMSGFIRFVKTKSDTYYAAYSPENNITGFLMPEFASRFPIMCFVLHDVMRGIIGIYNGNDYIVVKDDRKAEIEYAEDEKLIEKLWQKYYKSVNIVERYNRKQMLNYMPIKYTDNVHNFNDFGDSGIYKK